MAYEIGWGQMVDRAVEDPTTRQTQAKSIIWALKAFLMGQIGPGGTGVWTVVKSSDGATVAASDLWLSTYGTGNQIVWATAGTAHSWIVLQAPATMGSLFICLDVSGASNTAIMSPLRFSKLGFTVGGTTTLNRPTASDETMGSQWNGDIMDNPGSYPLKMNGLLSARGDFLFFAMSLGRGVTFNCLGMKVQEAKSVDQWPWVFMGYSNGYQVITQYWGPNFAPTNAFAYYKIGAGVGPVPGDVSFIWPYVGNSGNLLDGIPAGGDSQSHLSPGFPAYVGARSSATWGGVKGRLPDIRLGVFQVLGDTGRQAPGSGPVEYTLMGGLWLPFTVSPTW
jgi:hypothetical protein